MASVNMEHIDLDEEKINYGGKWFSASALKIFIKKKVEKDEFDITGVLNALNELETALRESKELRVKVHSNVAKAYEEMAQRSQRPVGYFIRLALLEFLRKEGIASARQKKPEDFKPNVVEGVSRDDKRDVISLDY